jgi:antibiotic biosynthesis monooxygenase (ABM) superfamily enzyme
MIVHNNDNNQGSNDDSPVTVIVTRKAKKGKIREFEEWMDGIIYEAMKFEGHMGVSIIRPTDLSNPEYVVIFRFNTYENLTKWERSEIKKSGLIKVKR